jgi:hypothetical protein
MNKLAEHSDFVAIAVLAFLLGVAQAPVLQVVRVIDMEHRAVQSRVLHNKPMVRVIHFFR